MSLPPSSPQKSYPPVYGGTAVAIWFLVITLVLALLLDYFMWRELGQNPLVAWLTAINLMALLTYFLDHLYNKVGYPLLPVGVFLVLAIVGGSIGAYLGMYVFHHSASRQIFRHNLLLIIIAQMIVFTIYMIFV